MIEGFIDKGKTQSLGFFLKGSSRLVRVYWNLECQEEDQLVGSEELAVELADCSVPF